MMVGWLRGRKRCWLDGLERGRDDGWMVERDEEMLVGWLRARKRLWLDG